MKKIYLLAIIILSLFIFGCETTDTGSFTPAKKENSTTGRKKPSQAGIITAGEWNDLENWKFWQGIEYDYSNISSQWKLFTNNRIAVQIQNNNTPLSNAKVELKKKDEIIWTAKTDNLGRAELWAEVFRFNIHVDLSKYTIFVNEKKIDSLVLKNAKYGVNEITIDDATIDNSLRVELCFIVDATGSMKDELSFLKDDLQSVIEKLSKENNSLDIFTSSVFYRDEKDEYLVKYSKFTNNLDETIKFINKQKAEGGIDFPEAVHVGLHTAVNNLQWSDQAKTRIAFLLLDAPPHNNNQVINDLQNTIKKAAEKGIKIIPIAASGTNKETEFLMRFFAILTSGTYVFITDESGEGQTHLPPTVGSYSDEKLNDLLVRLVTKYSE